MEQKMFSYENAGTSSYLTAQLLQESGVVHYQLEMLLSNEIAHLLPVSRRMMNGEMLLYYNISSRTALSQILERRKLKREELMQLLRGIVEAGADAAEYQLPINGLVMEPEYMYVDPVNCSPYFVYLPLASAEADGEAIKRFLLGLVMQGKLELSQDNFIQVLLETVNQEPFSLEALGHCIKQAQQKQESRAPQRPAGKQEQAGRSHDARLYAQSENSMASSGEMQRQPEPPQPLVPPQPSVQPPSHQEMQPTVEAPVPQRGAKPAVPGIPGEKPALPGKRKPAKADKKASKPEKTAKKIEKIVKTEQAEEDSDGFDAEKAKKKFLLPQAVIMVAVAALVSFGAFQNPETGALEMTNVLAAVILIVLTEVILYREAYVNSRKTGTKKAKTQKTKQVKEKPSKKGKPAVPGQVPADVKPEVNQEPKEEERAAAPVRTPRPSVSVPNPVPYSNPVFYSDETELEAKAYETDTETQIMGDGYGDMSAYLEYYENGIMTRVPLDRPSILIGRLKEQVDFAVANPKVGKIHAEFLMQNGSIFVKDLNSKNGTYINGSGQRIASNTSYPLKDRDRIILADCEFTLRCSVRE